MILRPYQENLISKAMSALSERKNTLAVAATGAGKTIMLAALAGRIGGKTLVLQHREELIQQNESKFRLVNPKSVTSFVKANDKNYSGEAVFAMVQTLSRNGNLDQLPRFDHLIIDEAHHAVAESYVRIIERVKDTNPDALLSGFTATPCRGDKKGLRRAGFDNCCDEISTQTLIELGFLVPPTCFILNLEGVSFDGINRTASGELDMEQVAEVMDVEVHNETIFQKWFELSGSPAAGKRKTVIFCSTVNHAENVCMVFEKHGVNAAVITGETPARQREELLNSLASNAPDSVQVVCNVAVLTEGWDCPPVSCVVLLRPCSAKSTMIQMIGRGLRIADNKDDCIILDFGMSLSTHGDLMASGKKGLEDRMKDCPECDSKVPPDVSECPICGYVWEDDGLPESNPYWFCPVAMDKDIPFESKDCHNFNPIPKDEETCPVCGSDRKGKKITLTNVEMIAFNIMQQSPFLWNDLFKTDTLLVATGFESAAFVVSKDGGNSFLAIGKASKRRPAILQSGNKSVCLSVADDFLRVHEASDAANKTKGWLRDFATQKQTELLNTFGYQGMTRGYTKYDAACHLSFRWNQKQIERLVGV